MKKELWQAWEDDVADALGGEKVKASGMTDLYKGDVKTVGWLIDAKETQSDGYSVSESFWKKLATWARNESREPCIAIRIDGESVYEIAVVTEMSYAVRHPEFVPEDQLKKQKQKKITRKMAGKKPTNFQVGKFKLVAYSFEEFVKDSEVQ